MSLRQPTNFNVGLVSRSRGVHMPAGSHTDPAVTRPGGGTAACGVARNCGAPSIALLILPRSCCHLVVSSDDATFAFFATVPCRTNSTCKPYLFAGTATAPSVRRARSSRSNNVVSQSVPHLHVHVVPRTKGDGLKGFFWPRTNYADGEERDGYAAKIAAALSRRR